MKYLTLFVLVATLLITACTTGYVVKEEEPIKIGVVGPLTGRLGFFGEWMRNGIEIAKDEINSQEGINGRGIELIYEDDDCQPKGTINALQKLVNADKVTAVIGPICGAPIKVAASFSTQNKIIIVSPGDNFGRIGEYQFSTLHLVTKEGETLANFAYKKLGLRRAGVMYQNNDWGIAQKDSFSKTFTSLDGLITATEPLEFHEKDFRSQLLKIKEKDSDGVYLSYSTIGEIINQMQELDMDIQILSDLGAENPTTIEIAGENAEGVVYTFPGISDTSKLTNSQKEYTKKYKQRYGKENEAISANAYDALIILAKALKACDNKNFDSDCMRDYILNLKEYDGASGTISFDKETWGAKKPFYIKTIRNGEFVNY